MSKRLSNQDCLYHSNIEKLRTCPLMIHFEMTQYNAVLYVSLSFMCFKCFYNHCISFLVLIFYLFYVPCLHVLCFMFCYFVTAIVFFFKNCLCKPPLNVC